MFKQFHDFQNIKFTLKKITTPVLIIFSINPLESIYYISTKRAHQLPIF